MPVHATPPRVNRALVICSCCRPLRSSETNTQKHDLQKELEALVAQNQAKAARVKAFEDNVHAEMHQIVQLKDDLEQQQDRHSELESTITRLEADLRAPPFLFFSRRRCGGLTAPHD